MYFGANCEMFVHLQSEGQASGGLVFQSLCRFYSAVDPSGLLDLPTSTATAVSLQQMTFCNILWLDMKLIISSHNTVLVILCKMLVRNGQRPTCSGFKRLGCNIYSLLCESRKEM